MKCWMIRKKGTELYSCAGSVPYFKKRGKVFYRYSDLRVHLNYFSKYGGGNNDYADCEIVEFDVCEKTKKDVFTELGLMKL